jgi:DNA polymerase-3 subunit alpha
LPKALAKKAKEFGMPAVALTDNGNMFGAIEFYFACKDAGVQPILGLEVFVAPQSRFSKGENKDLRIPNRKLVLLAKNNEGYRNLCQISSIGYKEGFYYKPRIDTEVLHKFSSSLICLTGGLQGEIPWTFLNQGETAALEKIKQLQDIFGEDLYLEMNRTSLPAWDTVNPFLLSAEKSLGVAAVAANDIHYLSREDQLAQEVLICIGSNKTLSDDSRFRLGSDQFFFKGPDQMRTLFRDVPQAVDRTLEIAAKCHVEFRLEDASGKPIYHLPSYPTPDGISIVDELSRLANEGLQRRFAEAQARKEAISETKVPIYEERLRYEIRVISEMGFTGYFLIVQDFIQWAKNNDIPVGPGRGSGAGSLVAYSLGITDLDPMPYNLVFERFLNPERISMPDFDVDFCQEGRGRVIDYVTQKYGESSVSQIITFGKLQARAALRDVGRVMGMTFSEVDVVAKLIPEKLGITLDEAIEMESRLKEMMEQEPRIQTLLDLARKIEGLVRHAGIHAAGVVIADGNIADFAPLYRGGEGENVVQYDMKHAEKIGLIKFDFLGLRTLTLIQDAFKLIGKNRGAQYKPQDIALTDPGIYEIICKGDTAGIFQFEGEGITDLIRKAKPTQFEDIVAINALYRPGPMDMIPSYLDRKNGQVKVEYLFPELENILKETHGIVVYQEQVQLIAARIANYSLGEADLLRRAMGKKIPEVMAKQKDRFLQGAKANGHDLTKASELFDLMAEFANYGFNKSHAAAYCVVAAQTAWLKNYYPVEFYAALLTTEMGDTDKIVKYVKDAKSHNITVRPPHLNHSEYKFTVKGDEIFFSLGAIKGVGESAVDAIVEAREKHGLFSSIEDFFKAVDLKRINKKTIECMIKAGAFDGFGYNRNELLLGYPKFIERADRFKKDTELGQVSLFAESQETFEKVQLEKSEDLSRAHRLAYEKEVLGFFLTDHPLNGLGRLRQTFGLLGMDELHKVEPKKDVRVLGIVSSLREILTKKGTRMAFAQFEDATSSLELVIFPDVFNKVQFIIRDEAPLIVMGQIQREGDTHKMLVSEMHRLSDMLKKTKRVIFHLQPGMAEHLPLLKKLCLENPGNTAISFDVELQDLQHKIRMDVTDPRGIEASSEFIEKAQCILGPGDFADFDVSSSQ